MLADIQKEKVKGTIMIMVVQNSRIIIYPLNRIFFPMMTSIMSNGICSIFFKSFFSMQWTLHVENTSPLYTWILYVHMCFWLPKQRFIPPTNLYPSQRQLCTFIPASHSHSLQLGLKHSSVLTIPGRRPSASSRPQLQDRGGEHKRLKLTDAVKQIWRRFRHSIYGPLCNQGLYWIN